MRADLRFELGALPWDAAKHRAIRCSNATTSMLRGNDIILFVLLALLIVMHMTGLRS